MNPPPRRHGSVAIGRTIVLTGCVLVMAVNGWIFLAAHNRPHPLPLVEGTAAIILVWMIAGVSGLCLRKLWGRYFILLILCLGTAAFSIGGILIVLEQNEAYSGLTGRMFIAVVVYLIVTVVLTYSHHVRRLTSRAWD